MPVEDFDPNILARIGTTTIPSPPNPVFAIPTPIPHKAISKSSKDVKPKEL